MTHIISVQHQTIDNNNNLLLFFVLMLGLEKMDGG